MKILSIFKGFVTNSSSANYWLEDEDFKIEHSSSTDKIVEQKTNSPAQKENNTNLLTSGIIFLSFFIIAAIVIVIRKFKKV